MVLFLSLSLPPPSRALPPPSSYAAPFPRFPAWGPVLSLHFCPFIASMMSSYNRDPDSWTLENYSDTLLSRAAVLSGARGAETLTIQIGGGDPPAAGESGLCPGVI